MNKSQHMANGIMSGWEQRGKGLATNAGSRPLACGPASMGNRCCEKLSPHKW